MTISPVPVFASAFADVPIDQRWVRAVSALSPEERAADRVASGYFAMVGLDARACDLANTVLAAGRRAAGSFLCGFEAEDRFLAEARAGKARARYDKTPGANETLLTKVGAIGGATGFAAAAKSIGLDSVDDFLVSVGAGVAGAVALPALIAGKEEALRMARGSIADEAEEAAERHTRKYSKLVEEIERTPLVQFRVRGFDGEAVDATVRGTAQIIGGVATRLERRGTPVRHWLNDRTDMVMLDFARGGPGEDAIRSIVDGGAYGNSSVGELVDGLFMRTGKGVTMLDALMVADLARRITGTLVPSLALDVRAAVVEAGWSGAPAGAQPVSVSR